MKKLLVLAAMAVLSASAASAEGINLSWNDCGLFGTQNATFNCATTSGAPFTIVASYIPPPGVDEFLGLSAQIDITTADPTLPAWWQHGTAFCRGTSGLSVSFDFTGGPFSCFDFWQGQAAGGFAYDVGFGTPNRGRLRVQCAIPIDQRGPVDASTEYYAFKTNLQRSKSTGTGACAGCLTSACIVLNAVQLFQPPGAPAGDPEIFNPVDRNFVTWQSPVGGPPGCPLSTPTTNKSWGQVKSLYR